jgi:DNA-binding response OmpR family regulator
MAKTKKILIISSGKELIDYFKISSLTLTKLNCQIEINAVSDFDEALKLSKAKNLDLILLDLEIKNFSAGDILKEIRNDPESKSKKIIGFYSGEIDKAKFHQSGCDSIMIKAELMRNAVNILQY